MEVRFKNFRCFKDTGLLKLKKITLLMGENSSGKTSFLAGLNHISGLLNGKEVDLNTPPFELGAFQDILHRPKERKRSASFTYEYKIDDVGFRWLFRDDLGAPYVAKYQLIKQYQDFWEGVSFNKSSIEINLRLSDQEVKQFKGQSVNLESTSRDSIYRIRFKQKKAAETSLVLGSQDQLMEMVGRLIVHYGHPLSPRLISQYNEEIRLHDHKGQSRGQKNRSPRIVIHELLKSLKVLPNRTFAFSPSRTEASRIYLFSQNVTDAQPDGSHVPHLLLKTEKNKEGNVVLNYINEIVNEFGIDSGLFNRIFVDSPTYPFSIMVELADGTISNLKDVGYGVSQMLPLIYDIIDIKGTDQLLIQQPEAHLHPRAQAAYASLMVRIVKERKVLGKSRERRKGNTQFVIETHSDFILERLKYEIEQGNIASDDVGILFFDTEGKPTKIHQIDLGKDGLPVNPPASYRRFFLEELDRVWP